MQLMHPGIQHYIDRIVPLRKSLLPGITPAERQTNRDILLLAREGRYLIKLIDSSLCYVGFGYLMYNYDPRQGGFYTNSRKFAQWFTVEEAIAITEQYKKTFRFVKR